MSGLTKCRTTRTRTPCSWPVSGLCRGKGLGAAGGPGHPELAAPNITRCKTCQRRLPPAPAASLSVPLPLGSQRATARDTTHLPVTTGRERSSHIALCRRGHLCAGGGCVALHLGFHLTVHLEELPLFFFFFNNVKFTNVTICRCSVQRH